MARRDLAQGRPLDAAAVEGDRTTRVEMAAGWRRGRARDLALDGSIDPAPLLQVGDLGQQPLRIGVVGMGEELPGRRVLDDAPEIHDDDAVGDMLHHAQIVTDEEIGQVEIAPQLHEQIQDLRLDRDVERCDRLVADEKARLHS